MWCNPSLYPDAFVKLGYILTASMAVPSRADDEENDLLNEVDADTDIQNLIEHTMINEECCSGTEYVSGDDCLPVCLELDHDRWDEHFMANIAGAQECNNEDEEGRSDNGSDREDQVAIPQLKSFNEAIASLEQVQHFLECHGMSVEANALSSNVDRIAAKPHLMIISLHDYFPFQ